MKRIRPRTSIGMAGSVEVCAPLPEMRLPVMENPTRNAFGKWIRIEGERHETLDLV